MDTEADWKAGQAVEFVSGMHSSIAVAPGTAERTERKTAFAIHPVRLVALLDRVGVIVMCFWASSEDFEPGDMALLHSGFAMEVAITGGANA